MSNQVGLMLSFIFLAFFIVFSSEIISYQQFSAICLSKTSNVAIYIQNNGYKEYDQDLLEQLEYFESYEIVKENASNGFVAYHLSTTNEYTSFTEMFSYLNQDVICELTVYRKEK